MDSRIDKNGTSTALAIDTNGVIKPLLVDPTTGRLLVEIVACADDPVASTVIRVDDNGRETAVAIDDNGVIRPLLIDSDCGYLLVDVVFE